MLHGYKSLALSAQLPVTHLSNLNPYIMSALDLPLVDSQAIHGSFISNEGRLEAWHTSLCLPRQIAPHMSCAQSIVARSGQLGDPSGGLLPPSGVPNTFSSPTPDSWVAPQERKSVCVGVSAFAFQVSFGLFLLLRPCLVTLLSCLLHIRPDGMVLAGKEYTVDMKAEPSMT
jgi:hypothetical protein